MGGDGGSVKVTQNFPAVFALRPARTRAALSVASTHSLRRPKVTQIYTKTGNLRAGQLLSGRTQLDSKVRYLDVELEDALAIAEAIEIYNFWAVFRDGTERSFTATLDAAAHCVQDTIDR